MPGSPPSRAFKGGEDWQQGRERGEEGEVIWDLGRANRPGLMLAATLGAELAVFLHDGGEDCMVLGWKGERIYLLRLLTAAITPASRPRTCWPRGLARLSATAVAGSGIWKKWPWRLYCLTEETAFWLVILETA